MNSLTTNLRDIHLPEKMGLVSFAIGWWFLLIFIIVFLFFCIWIYKKITKKTVFKTARNNLLKLKQNKQVSPHQKIKHLSILIRQVSISSHSRTESASLTGEAWLEYLDSFVDKNIFNSKLGQLLIYAPYQKDKISEIEVNQLILLTEEWLNTQS
ncbi:MAG: DUF4381 domain-containing protein [Methylococcales bacterium]|nr:DUF4381 domain-containing protein [Methylococcales bacterium]